MIDYRHNLEYSLLWDDVMLHNPKSFESKELKCIQVGL